MEGASDRALFDILIRALREITDGSSVAPTPRVVKRLDDLHHISQATRREGLKFIDTFSKDTDDEFLRVGLRCLLDGKEPNAIIARMGKTIALDSEELLIKILTMEAILRIGDGMYPVDMMAKLATQLDHYMRCNELLSILQKGGA